MRAANVIALPARRLQAIAQTAPFSAAQVVVLAEHRRRRAGYPEGWPDGETGQKMEEMAVWAFEHSIEAGRHDTMKDARIRTMNMVASLQRHFEERRNERG